LIIITGPTERREEKMLPVSSETSGRCCDHNFRRFLPIFGEKIGVFLKNQKSSSSLSKKGQYFAKYFGDNIFKIITSVPEI
jgi:hypothetical protein